MANYCRLVKRTLASTGLPSNSTRDRYMVARRRNEIGVRVALGADRGCVVRPVLREAVLLLAIGIAIGMAVLLLSTVALLASYWPAMRAARLEPMSALRED